MGRFNGVWLIEAFTTARRVAVNDAPQRRP
jgi:hypothetical protein